jgi:hypothetical protein
MEGEGRGLLQIEAAHKSEIIDIAEYLRTEHKYHEFVNGIKTHEVTRNCILNCRHPLQVNLTNSDQLY